MWPKKSKILFLEFIPGMEWPRSALLSYSAECLVGYNLFSVKITIYGARCSRTGAHHLATSLVTRHINATAGQMFITEGTHDLRNTNLSVDLMAHIRMPNVTLQVKINPTV